jgi:exosortase D (VPLPA-CTERM-specific)
MSMNKKHALAIALIFGSLAFAFWDVAAKLVTDWGRDENYSHGFLMVPLAAFVVWRERATLLSVPSSPSAWGLFIVAGSLLTLGAGRLGAELFLTRIALIGTLAGIVVFLWGFRLLRALAFPFLLLLLAIPIPAIIFNQITFPLQLLASKFGEASISACQIPVLREGNVIILANTTLEVAEACSGIRSLVSLLALAVIWGYLSESPMWLRWLLAAAAVPIAIFANGIRVAGTGIAAHALGPEAAEGFFHTFSGWLVFVVAGALLLVVHRAALWLRPSAEKGREHAPAEAAAQSLDGPAARFLTRAVVAAACVAIAAAGLRLAVKTEQTPLREPLSGIPARIGEWSGLDAAPFSQAVLDVLRVDEYVNRSYTAPGAPPVGLYVGYYASQRQGQTMHSPMNCMPGSGWEPAGRARVSVEVPAAPGSPPRTVEVNRVVVQKGLDRMLVIYWYQAHGRVVASEYWGKIYTVVDAIRLNRSDGAMVRLIVPVNGQRADGEREAERVALDFARALFPAIGRYLPG